MSNVSKLDNLSIQDIERYGSDIQDGINTAMESVLVKAKVLEVGDVGDKLNEVAVLANKATKGVAGKHLPAPFVKFKKFMGRYDTVENKLIELNTGISEQKEKLDSTLNDLIESREIMVQSAKRLEKCETELKEYADSLVDNTDGIRTQAVANRLKTISTLRASTEQSAYEVAMLIQHNKEITHQLEETVTNVVPMFKMQLVTALSIKAHEEALDLRENITNVANKLVIENAKNIQKANDRMLDNRSKAIIDPEKLIEANDILQQTISKTIDMAGKESEMNYAVAEKLKSISDSYTNGSLYKLEDNNRGN